MDTTAEQLWEGLATALVMADLSDPSQRASFADQLAQVTGTECDEVLSSAVEQMRTTLESVDSGEDPEVAAAVLSELVSAALQVCAAAVQVATAPPSAIGDSAEPLALSREANAYAADPAVVVDFVCGAAEQLDEAEALLSAAAIGDSVDVAALFRCFHTLKGMSGFLSLDDFANASHATETILETVRSERRAMHATEIEHALEAVDAMRSMLAVFESPSRDRDGAQAHAASERAKRRRGQEQVRVNAARLEELLDAMGELAVAEAELAAAVKATGDPVALRCLERLERIARDMQGTSTTLRMVSLKQTFAKMARVVHDATARSGKQVELVVAGENTEIDRAMVEVLSDPLVHLLRNAIDHGIETPQERREVGKPATGSIELRASHRSGSVYIEIEDDGRGIDLGRLVRRANELGIDFDRDHPLPLIFRPGFSTAEEITELSGRGVGMDAVSSAVAVLRGQIDVASEPGTGTRFTIRLPLTLAIIDGIVLRAGAERYVVPTHFVQRTASAVGAEIVSTAGRGEVLVLPDGPVPVTSVTRVMGGELDAGDVAVILVDGDERFALIVDEVIGQQSLVIKPLTGPTTEAVGPAGAALMGDGRVALVVDPTGLSRALWWGGEPKVPMDWRG